MKSKKILVGTVLGLLVGAFIGASWAWLWTVLNHVLPPTQFEPEFPLGHSWFTFFSISPLESYWGILQGAGWGALIGTVAEGFKVVAEAIGTSPKSG